MNSKGLLVAAALAVTVGAMGSLVSGGASAAEPVKVGAVEALTGPAAKYGVMIREGFELATDEINAKGGVLGGKLEVIFEDSATQKEQAINAVRKLIGRDHVAALLGPTLSQEMFGAGPVANEREIPIIGTSTTADGITDMGPWVFRTALPEADVIPVTLKKAQAKFGIKRVALLYANDDAVSKSGFDIMKRSLEKMGIEIATIEAFSTKDTDFSAQLTKVKSLGVDALCVSALVEPAAGLLLQARQLGLPKTIPIIGGNGFNSPKLIEIAGEAAENVMVGSPWFIGKATPQNQTFVTNFKAKYGSEPDQFAAQAYDTMHILAEAFTRAGGTDNKALQAALLKTSHDGVTGPFRFTDHRDPSVTEGVVVVTTKAGKFVVFE